MKTMTNEELVMLAKNGDKEAEEYLLIKNRNLMKTMARRFLNIGETVDDLYAVAMTKMWEAISTYDPDKGKPFHKFYIWVLENEYRMILVRKRRQKRTAILESFDADLSEEDGNYTLEDIVPDANSSYWINRFELEELMVDVVSMFLRMADPLEAGIMEARFIRGYTRKAVSDHLGKSVDVLMRMERDILECLRNIYYSRLYGTNKAA